MGKIATCDHFRMGDWLAMPATAGAAPFIIEETGSTGAAHTLGANGFYEMSLDATNEAQILKMSMGDILRYDIDDLQRVEFYASVTSASLTGISVVFGVASAKNDDADAVTESAYFKLAGSFAVVCETDDGTNDNDDKATGQTLVTATPRRFAIDFSRDVQTVAPPGTSKAGKGNVHFYMDDSNGYLKRVCSSTLFDMSNYSAGLQIYAMVYKGVTTTLATLAIKDIKVEHKLIS